MCWWVISTPISEAGRAWAREHAVVFEHPADKDLTDTELALTVAADARPQRVIVLAGTGTRLDHTVAALGALGSDVTRRRAPRRRLVR